MPLMVCGSLLMRKPLPALTAALWRVLSSRPKPVEVSQGVASDFTIELGAGAGVFIAAVVDLVGAIVPGDGLDPMRVG
jgi:hypothetical protein